MRTICKIPFTPTHFCALCFTLFCVAVVSIQKSIAILTEGKRLEKESRLAPSIVNRATLNKKTWRFLLLKVGRLVSKVDCSMSLP